MAEQKQIQKKIYVFVFINLRGKFILCYFVYAYVASENQALSLVFIYRNSSVIYCLGSLKEKMISETQRILSIVDHRQ